MAKKLTSFLRGNLPGKFFPAVKWDGLWSDEESPRRPGTKLAQFERRLLAIAEAEDTSRGMTIDEAADLRQRFYSLDPQDFEAALRLVIGRMNNIAGRRRAMKRHDPRLEVNRILWQESYASLIKPYLAARATAEQGDNDLPLPRQSPPGIEPLLRMRTLSQEEIQAATPAAEATVERSLAALFLRLGPPPAPTEIDFTPVGHGGGGAQQ
ncbi:hypothetical protein [Streptomyces anandii]|uniref:hypothetical protein n=1 Tax=Streptomyces anandii TaxID=285454 RepID=UPI0037BD79DC